MQQLHNAYCKMGRLCLSSKSIWDLQDGNDLDEVEGNLVELSNENSSHTLEKSSSIHVNSCANGQDKTADVL